MAERVVDKVVFLDMDGVLCTPRAALALGDRGIITVLDPVAVGMLNILCLRADAELVISSSWRKMYPEHAFRSMLWMAGVRVEIHRDWRTVDAWDEGMNWHGMTLRGHEIEEWLSRHPEITHHVILDDDADFTRHQLDNHHVHCDPEDGMMFKHWRRASEIMGLDGVIDRGD
jgi:hypothetical protein